MANFNFDDTANVYHGEDNSTDDASTPISSSSDLVYTGEDNYEEDVPEEDTEEEKIKKKKKKSSKYTFNKPISTKINLTDVGFNKKTETSFGTKPKASFGEKLNIKSKKYIAPEPTEENFPLKVNESFFQKEDPSWYESKIKDEDEIKQNLQSKLGKDFEVQVPFDPGTNTIKIFSKKTGKAFNYSWEQNTGTEDISSGRAADMVGGEKPKLNDLNKWVFENSRYNPNQKEAKQYKASGNLSYDDALEAADRSRNWWALTKEAVMGGVAITPHDKAVHVSNVANLWNEPEKYAKLFPDNASDDQKVEAVRKVALSVQQDANKLLDQQVFNSDAYKMHGLTGMIKDGSDAQAFYDNIAAKNKQFIYGSGMSEKVVKQFFANRVKQLADNETDTKNKEIAADVNKKSIDENLNFYEPLAAKSFDPDQQKTYTAWKRVDQLNESLFKLKNDPKYSITDAATANKEGNMQAELAKAKQVAKKLSADGDKYNHYFYDPSTAKIAVVKTSDVNLAQKGTTDITQKVISFTDMYHGMPKESLAKKFVEVSSQKLRSDNDGNKKMSVITEAGAIHPITYYTLQSEGVNIKYENNKAILTNVTTKQLSRYTSLAKFKTYNTQTKSAGNLINGDLESWKNRNSDLMANSAAINNLYLLNRAPSSELTNVFGSAWDGLVGAINKNHVSQRQKVTTMENVAASANVNLTKKSKLENVASAAEEVATATGAMIPTVAKIALVTALTEGAGTAIVGEEAIAAFNALKLGNTAEKALYHTGMALKEEATMRMAGLGPTSGASFYVSGQLLPKTFRPFMESWGRGGNNVTNFVYNAVKGGVQMDAAALTENAYDSINSNKKFHDYLNENYKDFPSWFRKTMGNAISFGFMGSTELATKHGRKSATLTFASGNQISEATNIAGELYTKADQELNNYKENNTSNTDPNYSKTIKKHENALEKAKFDYSTLLHLNNSWQQTEAIKTDEGLKDYIQKENKDFFDQYQEKYGKPLELVVSSDPKTKTSFVAPKIDPKTKEVVENGKIIINKETATEGGIFNKGKIAHELAHASDYIVKQEKMEEYSKIPIKTKNAEGIETENLPTPEQISLYGNKLDAEKNQRIIDILAKHFPDLMGEKKWLGKDYKEASSALEKFKKEADPKEEGYQEKLNKLTADKEKQNIDVIEAVKQAYEKRDESGKLLNPAEVNDEIVKRVIEELGDRSGNNLSSPFKARGFFKGLAVDFSNLMNKNNKVNYEIKDANELFELINNYAQSVHQGGGASYKYSDALARVDLSAFGDMEASEVKLDDEAAIKKYDAIQEAKQKKLEEAKAIEKAPDTKESKDLQKELIDLDEAYENGDEFIDEEDYESKRKNILFKIAAEEKRKIANPPAEVKTIEKKLETEEDIVKDIIRNEKGSISSNKVQDLYDKKGVEAAQDIINLFKPITNRIVDKRRDAPGFDKELLTDEIETGKGGILDLIQKYKPESGIPLAAYINKYLPLRAIATSRKLLDAEFKADIEEQKGLMAEETRIEAKEKASYKNTLDSKVFGTNIVKDMTDKIITIARTIKSKIDEPISLNKTVTPFISEIRDEVGKQLDIIVKKEMGGKKDNELKNWLLKNKRYTLENMTTTWLMGKDGQGGIPQAIQKRIDGKWVNYPEWVNKKIDREAVSTDNAGRTSGAELARRLPNVFNNISDVDFLAQVIGPDGNPIRGRKESLAKAVSEESAFDIINNDLANEGPIFEAITTNQERRGVIIAENFAIEVARQAERGNVKQSKDLIKAEKNLIDIVNNPDALTRYHIFNYINDKSYEGLDKDIKEKLDKGIKELSIAYENKIKFDLDENFAKKYKTAEGAYAEFDTYFSEFQKNKLETKETLLGIKDKTFERIDKPENRKNFAEVKERLKTFAVESLGIKDTNGKIIKDFNSLPEENKQEALANVKNLLDVIKMPLAGATEAAGWMFGELGHGAIKGNKDLFDSLNLGQYGYSMPGRSVIKDPSGKSVSSPLESQRSSAKDIVNSLKEGKDNYNKEKRDNDSDNLRNSTLKFLDDLKNSDMSAEAKATLIVFLGKHIDGPFRGMAKVDTVLPSLEGDEYEFEHAKPISLTVQEAIAYTTGLPFHGKFIDNLAELDTRFQENVVSIIPKEMANLVNVLNKSTSPYKFGGDVYDRYIGKRMKDYLAANGWIVEKGDFTKIEGNNKKIPGIDFKSRYEQYKVNNKIEAVRLSLDLNKEPKGIGVFDFDDTVGLTKSNVLYTMPGDRVLYHGAPEGKNVTESSAKGVRFFATDIKEAEEYARMHSGKVQEVVIPDSQIVDEEVAINKIKELGLTPKNKDFDIDEVQFHELIDPRFEESLSEPDIKKLFTELKKEGVKALSYEDGAQVSGKSTTSIAVIDPSVISTRKKLNGAEFAKEGSKLLAEGAKFDFSEFSKVVEGKPGPMVEKIKKMLDKFGNKDMFILTARPAEAAGPIKKFLDSIGIDIPIENITGLGNSSSQAKADWMVDKAAKGYNDFYFADDHIGNVEAVRKALEVLDVKSKIQQAKEKFSKDLSKEFNKIIFQNEGVESFKVFSDITAKRRGVKKNRFDFYVPPSAGDFELSLYKFMGKGALGEKQKEFFNEALLKPYSEGNDLMDAARQSIKKNYKELINRFPEVNKKLPDLTQDKDFTYDQAVRVAMWNESGEEIPGISKADTKKLTDIVNNDPELKSFKNELIIMGRQGDGWIKPTVHWDADTIIADLHNITEGEGRKKFLGQFIDNAEQIFGTWEGGKLVGSNMNKIEAVYGTNVREAIEDSIYRMTNGKNRSYGSDKETTRWSNWVNGSTGAIMFLNSRSALLQLIGSVNFLNLRDNNPYAAGKAFANQKQYWEDFAHIWNSDKMKERRGGLKEDVAAAEIASAAANSKNKANAVISYLLKIGYTPTMLADSFAIASGGSPFYRNRINSYLKEGMSEAEAEKAAWLDFTKVSDETQQSGDPRDISKQQASGAGRLLLTFQNTAMQQSRIVKKSFLDLKNGRGDTKTHLAKIGYYIAVQNIMFSALQTGLFTVFFNDEPKEVKKKTTNKKLLDVADGVLDTILRGTGFIGGIIATGKNVIEKLIEEKEKKQPDYAKPVFEFANISPPIGSKLQKAYRGLTEYEKSKDIIKARGFSMVQNGRLHLSPIYSVIGKETEAITNFPLDRIVNKVNNISETLNSQNKAWQRVMTGLGWSPYSVGIKGSKEDLQIKAEAKQGRKEEGKIKSNETRQKTRDSIANLPEDEYEKYVLKQKAKREARKDSINNLPPAEKEKYLENKTKSEDLKKRQKEILKEAKADSIADLSPAEKANYNKKIAEEKALKKKESHDKYVAKKQALKDSLAGLSPREQAMYKAKKKAERHQYYLDHKEQRATKSKRKKKTAEPEYS